MATITCLNCSETEVWDKVATANDNDTVVLPNNRPTGGTFTLTYGGNETAAIAYNAPANPAEGANSVQARLEALASIGSGNVSVARISNGTLTGFVEFGWKVTFTGALAGGDRALMTATSSITSATPTSVVVGEFIKGVTPVPPDIPAKNEVQVVVIGSPWSSSHTLDKAITLQGNGVGGKTNIVDAKNGTYLLMGTSGTPNGTLHITGITFRNAVAGVGTIEANGVLRFIGNNLNGWRLLVDYCDFDNLHQFPIFTTQVFGCVRHCNFINTRGVAYTYASQYWPEGKDPPGNPADYATGHDRGDGAWASDTGYGTNKMMYFEDNIMIGAGQDVMFDGTEGGKLCVRHNTIAQYTGNSAIISCHGSEGARRSIRHLEMYNNLILAQGTTQTTVNQRGGTVIIFNNRVATVTGGRTAGLGFQHDRHGNLSYFGRASGYCPVDVNVDETEGRNFPGGTLGPDPSGRGEKHFFEGTASAVEKLGPVATPTATKITFSGVSWGTNDWRGFSLSDIDSDKVLTSSQSQLEAPEWLGGLITSSDANSVTVKKGVFGVIQNFEAGEPYRIYRCVHPFDGIGMAGSRLKSLITGGRTPSGPNPKPAVLPLLFNVYDTTSNGTSQLIEPCYEWNNYQINNSANLQFSAGDDYLFRAGIHFFSDTRKTDYPNWMPNATSWCGSVDDTVNRRQLPDSIGTNQGTGGYVYPWQANPGPVADPQISVPASLAYSSVVINTSKTLDIGVTNNGGNPLIVTAITYPGSGYWAAGSTAPNLPFTVTSGNTVNWPVTFTPVAVGNAFGPVTFTSNTVGGNNVTNVTGTGAPVPLIPIMSIPASHPYGSVLVFTSVPYDIPVQNIGGATLNVASVSYPTGWSGLTTAFTVAPGATVNRTATFTPTNAVPYSGTITFNSDDGNSAHESMTVTGTGLPVGGGPSKAKPNRKNVLISRF